MQFMIVAAESQEDMARRKTTDKAAFEAYMAPWMKFHEELDQAGAYVTGNPLEMPETATCVRVRNGKREVEDGPFADTKEQLGGYFIIDVADLDEAKKWAAKCPAANGGLVELRTIALLEGGE